MRIDLPGCGFKDCKYNFDCNCKDRNKYEKCEYKSLHNIIPYDCDYNRIKELIKADKEGRCVTFKAGYPITKIYNLKNEDGLYTAEICGIIEKEEYELYLKNKDDYNFSYLKELIKSTLSITVGSLIYQIMFDRIITPRKIIEISLDINNKGIRYYCKTVDKTGVISYIEESEIGKTVFLSRIEADTALESIKKKYKKEK